MPQWALLTIYFPRVVVFTSQFLVSAVPGSWSIPQHLVLKEALNL